MSSVDIIDVAECDDENALQDLLVLHSTWFPEHGHVLPELIENAQSPRHRGALVVHQLLARVDTVAAGFIVVHANLHRHIGLIHFLAVQEKFRHGRGHDIATRLVQAAVDAVAADFRTAGIHEPCGVVAESDADRLAAWARWDFEPLPIDYAEPYFGMHWSQHGAPTFFPMTLVHRAFPGAGASRAGRAALEAFLIDHYRLPPTHDRVAGPLSTA